MTDSKTGNEFTPEQRAELGDLEPLYNRLNSYEIPEPDSNRLLMSLKPILAQRREPEPMPMPEPIQRGIRDWLRLAWIQTELLEAPFWWASLLLVVMGILFGASQGRGLTLVLFLFVSPLVAVGGVAYIFRPATRTLLELEQLSHVQSFELLYARLALILALNIGVASGLLIVLWTQSAQIVLWRLLLIWFGPMICLTGIALFCSIRWNMMAGIVVPLLVWGAMIALGWRESILDSRWDAISVGRFVTQISTSNTMLLFGIVAFIVGIFLFYKAGQVTEWH